MSNLKKSPLKLQHALKKHLPSCFVSKTAILIRCNGFPFAWHKQWATGFLHGKLPQHLRLWTGAQLSCCMGKGARWWLKKRSLLEFWARSLSMREDTFSICPYAYILQRNVQVNTMSLKCPHRPESERGGQRIACHRWGSNRATFLPDSRSFLLSFDWFISKSQLESNRRTVKFHFFFFLIRMIGLGVDLVCDYTNFFNRLLSSAVNCLFSFRKTHFIHICDYDLVIVNCCRF